MKTKKKKVIHKTDLPDGRVAIVVNNGKITTAVSNLNNFPKTGRYVVELTPVLLTEAPEYAKKGSEQKRVLMLPSCGKIWDFSEGIVNPFYNSALKDS